MTKPPIPTITIDANCVIGLFDADSATATSVGDLRTIFRRGLSGDASIAITTRIGADLGRDRNEARRAAMLAQLEMFPIVASIQRSRVDTLDPNVIVDPIHRALWREIQGIVFPSLTDASGKLVNKIADVDHLAGHRIAGRDVFVTDDRDLLRRHAELRSGPGILIMSPADCVRFLDDHAARLEARDLAPRSGDARHRDPRLCGTATFDYSANDGHFAFGSGVNLFETKWSKAGGEAVHAYRDPDSIDGIALAKGMTTIREVTDAAAFDFSSRARTPSTGQIVIWRNVNGIYAATRVVSVKDDTRGADRDELTFEFAILTDGSSDFSRF